MNIAICDDDTTYCEIMKMHVAAFFENRQIPATIDTYLSGESLLEAGVSSLDICFLDIEMPEIQGLDLAKEIMKQNRACKIVFVTSHDEYVQEGYKVRAYRYLYKPIAYVDLEEVLADAWNDIKERAGVFVTNSKEPGVLLLRDIIMIESLGDEAALYTNSAVLKDNRSMNVIGKELDDRFFRCHRAFIVNLWEITKIEYKENRIQMSNGLKADLAVRKKTALKKAFYQQGKRRLGWE